MSRVQTGVSQVSFYLYYFLFYLVVRKDYRFFHSSALRLCNSLKLSSKTASLLTWTARSSLLMPSSNLSSSVLK